MNQTEKGRDAKMSERQAAFKCFFNSVLNSASFLAVAFAVASAFVPAAVPTAQAATVSLDWDGNFNGKITSHGKWHHIWAADYRDKHGTVTMSGLPNSYNVVFKASETGTNLQFVGSPSVRNATTKIPGYEAVSAPLSYGTWYFAKDSSRFMFKPDREVIDGLNTGESVTAKLEVEVYNAQTHQKAGSDDIQLVIHGFPNVSISRNASQVTEGNTISFTVTASAASFFPMRVDLSPSSSTYLATGYPDHVVIPAGGTSATYSLETASNKLPNGTNQVSMSVSVVKRVDYELGSSTQSSFSIRRSSN